MSEWWTYRLSDFLMFTPNTYYRLFELYNAALWPLAIATMLLGLGMITLSWRGKGRVAVPALLAAIWLLVAYAFHYRRYATINLAAHAFAGAFLIEAVLLAGWAILNRRGGSRAESANRIGVAIAGTGLLLLPLASPLVRQSWSGVELFGLAPDPTAVVTLGLLLTLGAPRWLLVIPLLWCVMSWATLWSMQTPDAWVMALVGLAAIVVSLAGRRSRKA